MSIFQLFRPIHLTQPPAFFHPRILVGPGDYLTKQFADRYNITHVINCAFDQFSPAWWRKQFPEKYKVLNAIDAYDVNILDWYPEFEQTMHQFLQEGDGVVYVHCHAGVNRSGFLALAYAAKNMNMELVPLIHAVRRQRPCILQNQVFMKQVENFVNGRVQDSKDKGTFGQSGYNGNAGFPTQRYRDDPERDENQTREPSPRDGTTAFGNLAPLFFE